jgi:hypothetical protein
MTIVGMFLRILPGILLMGGIAGLIGLAPMGPPELPRKHLLNRKLAGTVVVFAIGMAMIPSEIDAVSYIGLGTCLVAFVLYTAIVRTARKEFPALTPAQHLKLAQNRFKHLDPKAGKDQKDADA